MSRLFVAMLLLTEIVSILVDTEQIVIMALRLCTIIELKESVVVDGFFNVEKLCAI